MPLLDVGLKAVLVSASGPCPRLTRVNHGLPASNGNVHADSSFLVRHGHVLGSDEQPGHARLTGRFEILPMTKCPKSLLHLYRLHRFNAFCAHKLAPVECQVIHRIIQ
jgi:hypothetical protein